MDICEKYPINQCELINYCSDIDDYRPIQSTLLTRFTTRDCSELWRTTNQDYGAFYYRQLPHNCIPDNLKAKIHRRQNRFQDWLSYQIKCQNFATNSTNNNNNNNQTIFPSNRNETVRITHRKRFVSKCNNNNNNTDDLNQNTFSLCGEDGLISEYIVKKILKRLQCFINSNEYHDVAECAQILVCEILNQEPSLCTNEIIDRVITIMITPPSDNIQQSISNPCHSNISVEPISYPSAPPLCNNCPTIQESNKISNDLPLCPTINKSEPLTNCNQTMPIENIFEKLTNLENAISKVSNQIIQ